MDKGEHDGMGAVVKRWLCRYQLDRAGVPLDNAADVVGLLQASLQLGAHSTFQRRQRYPHTITRVFHYVEVGQVDSGEDLTTTTIAGTHNKIFQILGSNEVDHTIFKHRALACFCPTCIHGDYSKCLNIEYSEGDWFIHRVIPKGLCPKIAWPRSLLMVRGLKWIKLAQTMMKLLHFSLWIVFFAIRSETGNVEKVPYYILQCTRPLETLRESKSHSWDDSCFLEGDSIVTSVYMERARSTPVKY